MDAPAPTTTLDPGLTGQPARPIAGIDNGFLAGYRVRFDEAGPDGRLRTSALLRYAQDVAWRHSEQLGFDPAWYQARGLGWVVRGCELVVGEPIPIGHTLRVSTAVIGHRRIWARRLGECRLADGRPAATVTTDWVLLDGRNRVVRIPRDFGVAFTNPEVGSEILRVAGPTGDPIATIQLRVRPSDLDPLDHVNNAVYVDWLDEALEGAGWPTASEALPRTYRLEYLALRGAGRRRVRRPAWVCAGMDGRDPPCRRLRARARPGLEHGVASLRGVCRASSAVVGRPPPPRLAGWTATDPAAPGRQPNGRHSNRDRRDRRGRPV